MSWAQRMQERVVRVLNANSSTAAQQVEATMLVVEALVRIQGELEEMNARQSEGGAH